MLISLCGGAEEVAAAIAALQAAQAGLKALDIQALIAECEKLDERDYTEASWQAFARALRDAKAGAQGPDAPALAQALVDARAALVNVVALKAAIARGAEVDARRFTADSMARLASALDEGAARLANGSAQEVEQTRQAILSALAALTPQVEPGEAMPGATGGAGAAGNNGAGDVPAGTGASGAQGTAGRQSGASSADTGLPSTGDVGVLAAAACGMLGACLLGVGARRARSRR